MNGSREKWKSPTWNSANLTWHQMEKMPFPFNKLCTSFILGTTGIYRSVPYFFALFRPSDTHAFFKMTKKKRGQVFLSCLQVISKVDVGGVNGCSGNMTLILKHTKPHQTKCDLKKLLFSFLQYAKKTDTTIQQHLLILLQQCLILSVPFLSTMEALIRSLQIRMYCNKV